MDIQVQIEAMVRLKQVNNTLQKFKKKKTGSAKTVQNFFKNKKRKANSVKKQSDLKRKQRFKSVER
jgi:hypothetical protein